MINQLTGSLFTPLIKTVINPEGETPPSVLFGFNVWQTFNVWG